MRQKGINSELYCCTNKHHLLSICCCVLLYRPIENGKRMECGDSWERGKKDIFQGVVVWCLFLYSYMLYLHIFDLTFQVARYCTQKRAKKDIPGIIYGVNNNPVPFSLPFYSTCKLFLVFIVSQSHIWRLFCVWVWEDVCRLMLCLQYIENFSIIFYFLKPNRNPRNFIAGRIFEPVSRLNNQHKKKHRSM